MLLKSINKEEGTDFVFPAVRGDGHFQGMKSVWSKAIQIAELPGITPHTLRHTMGSTSISTGEALALTGAILGHANQRSTAIYAHVQLEPSRKAANRVTKKIADALAGKPASEKRAKGKARGQSQQDDSELIRLLIARLAEGGPDAIRLRRALSETVANERHDEPTAPRK